MQFQIKPIYFEGLIQWKNLPIRLEWLGNASELFNVVMAPIKCDKPIDSGAI